MSFGEELRRERELREVSLRQISEATKISLRYLEALERNDFETLPGGVFNRGFVRAYSQFIGIDPEAMVNAYLLQEQSQGAGGKSASGPLRRGRSSEVAKTEAARRPWLRWGLLALTLAVLAALIYYFAILRQAG